MVIEAGYLIVRTYEYLYQNYVSRYDFPKPIYAIPRIEMKPNEFKIQYRGIDRNALNPYEKSKLLAEIRMSELEEQMRCDEDGFIFSLVDVEDVVNYLDDPDSFEAIWVRVATSQITPPKDFISIGYEPSYFVGDHFSASCDCMLIPRWHGTDIEGELFIEHFKKLNKFGLFTSPAFASEFLDFYLSIDWTERGTFLVSEIFIRSD